MKALSEDGVYGASKKVRQFQNYALQMDLESVFIDIYCMLAGCPVHLDSSLYQKKVYYKSQGELVRNVVRAPLAACPYGEINKILSFNGTCGENEQH